MIDDDIPQMVARPSPLAIEAESAGADQIRRAREGESVARHVQIDPSRCRRVQRLTEQRRETVAAEERGKWSASEGGRQSREVSAAGLPELEDVSRQQLDFWLLQTVLATGIYKVKYISLDLS